MTFYYMLLLPRKPGPYHYSRRASLRQHHSPHPSTNSMLQISDLGSAGTAPSAVSFLTTHQGSPDPAAAPVAPTASSPHQTARRGSGPIIAIMAPGPPGSPASTAARSALEGAAPGVGRARFSKSAPPGEGGGGGGTHPNPHSEVIGPSFLPGLRPIKKSSLAHLTPIRLGQHFSWAPLRTQHHSGGGWGWAGPQHILNTPIIGCR